MGAVFVVAVVFVSVLAGMLIRYLLEGTWRLAPRKREAAYWFKAMIREQIPSRSLYTGLMAHGVELGIPSRVACDMAYKLVRRDDLTLGEVREMFSEEAKKWRHR